MYNSSLPTRSRQTDRMHATSCVATLQQRHHRLSSLWMLCTKFEHVLLQLLCRPLFAASVDLVHRRHRHSLALVPRQPKSTIQDGVEHREESHGAEDVPAQIDLAVREVDGVETPAIRIKQLVQHDRQTHAALLEQHKVIQGACCSTTRYAHDRK